MWVGVRVCGVVVGGVLYDICGVHSFLENCGASMCLLGMRYGGDSLGWVGDVDVFLDMCGGMGWGLMAVSVCERWAWLLVLVPCVVDGGWPCW